MGEFSRECCTRYSIFPSSSIVKLLDSSSSSNTSRVRRVSRVNRVLLEVLDPKFLTKHRVNSRANFPTRYSTRIDSIQVEEVHSSGELAQACKRRTAATASETFVVASLIVFPNRRQVAQMRRETETCRSKNWHLEGNWK